MAKWTEVVVWSDRFSFPNLCPGCLGTQPVEHLRIRSERGRMTGFYLVATKWEHLWITVPFCKKCANRRERWEKYDLALLFFAAIASLVFAGCLVAWLDLPPWAFWAIFLVAAPTVTILCNRLLRDCRGVRVRSHNDNTVRFAFVHPEYAREFARLNRQVGVGAAATQ